MAEIDLDQVDHLIELRGVYDGWSIAVMKDGTMRNRWEDEPGFEGEAPRPLPGYERRWEDTDRAIREYAKPERTETGGGSGETSG